jgi:hypothetical protein
MEALASPPSSIISTLRPARFRATLLGECIRISLASVLLFSGLAKIRAPYELLASIYGYQLTGPLLSLAIATVLPWLELFVALCLWTKLLYRGALFTTSILMAIFSAALALALYRQLDISCGCFIAADKISYFSLLRSLALFIASVVGLRLALRSPTARDD